MTENNNKECISSKFNSSEEEREEDRNPSMLDLDEGIVSSIRATSNVVAQQNK
jgi:hypothetical protein